MRVTGWSGGRKTTWGTVLRRRSLAKFGLEAGFGLLSGVGLAAADSCVSGPVGRLVTGNWRLQNEWFPYRLRIEILGGVCFGRGRDFRLEL